MACACLGIGRALLSCGEQRLRNCRWCFLFTSVVIIVIAIDVPFVVVAIVVAILVAIVVAFFLAIVVASTTQLCWSKLCNR